MSFHDRKSCSHDLEREVLSFFEKNSLLDPPEMIVAYSGGIDSSVLLNALSSLGIFRLRAVHVVHGLRPVDELGQEVALVKATCRRLGIPLTVAKIGPGAIERFARDKKTSVENAARIFRYHILKKTARRFRIGTICTAHNADDNLETLIARFLKASSLDGLAGIPALRRIGKKCRLARPLLSVTRAEIEKYAGEKDIAFSMDSSNATTAYFRNRIRHLVVPVLDREFGGWRTGMLETSKKLAMDKKAVGAQVRSLMTACRIDLKHRTAHIPFEPFSHAPYSVRVRVLTLCLAEIGKMERIPFKALKAAADSIEEGRKRFEVLGWLVETGPAAINIVPSLDFILEDGYFFSICSEGNYNIDMFQLTAFWDEEVLKGKGFLFEGSFAFPLIVRSRKPGDMIETADGKVRIDDVLKSWHIEPRLRGKVPIIEDARGIVAVLPASLPDIDVSHEKFRNYAGPKDGRKLYIQLKGAINFDA